MSRSKLMVHVRQLLSFTAFDKITCSIQGFYSFILLYAREMSLSFVPHTYMFGARCIESLHFGAFHYASILQRELPMHNNMVSCRKPYYTSKITDSSEDLIIALFNELHNYVV